MDAVVIVVAVLVVAGAAVAWLVRRTRSAGVPEEEPTPAGDGAPTEPIRQVLTREALIDRDRRLDVSRWDNSPDGRAEEEIEGDLPTHFDREYLRRRQEE